MISNPVIASTDWTAEVPFSCFFMTPIVIRITRLLLVGGVFNKNGLTHADY